MVTRKEFVNQAKAWIGRKESDGSFKEIVDIFNSKSPMKKGYSVPWCAEFVGAVAIKTNQKDVPITAGVKEMIAGFKAKKLFVEDDSFVPQPGDIIFFDWKDDGKGDDINGHSHVGIVEKVDTKIHTIEGNKNDAVGTRTIDINGKYIRGFAVPKFDEDKAEEPAKVDTKPVDIHADDYTVTVKKGDTLSKIAKANNVTLKEVIEDNPQIKNPDLIHPGDKVTIDPLNNNTKVADIPTGKTYTVKVNSYLRIRKGPGTDYPEIGKLYDGNKVTVTEEKNGFGKIGTDKWVSMKWVK